MILKDVLKNMQTRLLFSVVLFLILVLNAPAYAVTEGDYTYETIGGGVRITGYLGTGENLAIPDTLGGQPVLEIGAKAFANRRIPLLIIPDSVKTIKYGAFQSSSIGYVVIGSGVTSIGDYAFQTNRLTSVTLPENVTTIGEHAFESNRLTSVTIPASVTTIGNGAFESNQLTNVIIPESVTSIGDSAFALNKLESITISANVTSIGDSVFAANQLKSITIPANVTSIGDHAFEANQLKSITIPASVTTIGNSAFALNRLESITIPASVISIGNAAFQLNRLTSVTIPRKNISLGVNLFAPNLNSASTIIYGVAGSDVEEYASHNNHQFVAIPPTIYTNTINPSDHGTVTADKSEAESNDPVLLTITPDSGYVISTLKLNGITRTPAQNLYFFYMPSENVVVDAVFISAGNSAAPLVSDIDINNNPHGTPDTVKLINLAPGDSVNVYSSLTSQDPLATGIVQEGKTDIEITISQLGITAGSIYLTITSPSLNESTRTQANYHAEGVDECFIATAAFGSKFEPSVALLRQFRDQFLLTNTFGTALVEFYYRNSPIVAAYITGSEAAKIVVRILLIPFIAIAYLFFHPIWILLLFIPLLYWRRQSIFGKLHTFRA